MLPISEFRAAVSAYRRRLGFVLAAGVGGTFAYMGSLAFFRDPLHAYLRGHFGEAAVEPLMGASMLPALVFMPAALLIGDRWAMNDPRLRCPSCGKTMTGMVALATATRNCGSCGKRVLAEPEPLD